MRTRWWLYLEDVDCKRWIITCRSAYAIQYTFFTIHPKIFLWNSVFLFLIYVLVIRGTCVFRVRLIPIVKIPGIQIILQKNILSQPQTISTIPVQRMRDVQNCTAVSRVFIFYFLRQFPSIGTIVGTINNFNWSHRGNHRCMEN